MPDSDQRDAFPTDDALCERCGYPLRGLTWDAVCPECGLAVSESSPVKRTGLAFESQSNLANYPVTACNVLIRTRKTFRSLSIQGSNRHASVFLMLSGLMAMIIYLFVFLAFKLSSSFHLTNSGLLELILGLIVIGLSIYALTYIEMLGVTAFSARRGWRVPFRLAERVCCYASVGWLPGAVIAGVGYWLLQSYAVGRPWFENYLGLVKGGWLCYGGLFVVSLLWFETLVWIGVRQVKYANGWKP